jgi:hypothetical protein
VPCESNEDQAANHTHGLTGEHQPGAERSENAALGVVSKPITGDYLARLGSSVAGIVPIPRR